MRARASFRISGAFIASSGSRRKPLSCILRPMAKLLRRLLPLLVIAAVGALLLYLPEIGPERYTDLATFFRVERRRQAFSGYAVAAVEQGSVLYVDGFGIDGTGKPIGADSPLFIGDASKSLAGTAALSLVRDRKLDLDAPARHYLPWFGFAGGAGLDVTPRHLLSQTSGVSAESFDDAHRFAPDLEGAARSLSAARPVAAPGSSFHYIETGYQALGLIMEKAAGKPYPELLAERILAPLGMARTTARPEGAGVATPSGSACFFGAALPRGMAPRPFEAPSSSVLSTASDVGLYMAFLVAPEKQKRAPFGALTVRALFLPLEQSSRFGFGWYLDGEGKGRAAYIDGSLEGFSSRIVVWPELDAGVAVLAAQSSLLQSAFALPALVDGARRIMLEGGAPRPFPLGRLYILLAVIAFVHVAALALQTGGALSWAKEVRDRAEARGGRGPILLASIRAWLGIAICVAALALAPKAMSLGFGRAVSWRTAFALEPGLAAWCASACFFGLLRDIARLAWLRGSRSAKRFR